MSKHRKVYGGPGTGKTHTLIGYMAQAQKEGRSLTYVTFSRAMAQDARERALPSRFVVNPPRVGTLHSVYSQLMGFHHFLDMDRIVRFFEEQHIPFVAYENVADSLEPSLGSRILSEFSAHRHAYRPLWPVDGHRGSIESLYAAYQGMKGRRLDYTDCLVKAKEAGSSPETEVMVVDEYQDMTPLMRDVTREGEKDADQVYIAGDDDQSIYGFMGASPELMLDHLGEEEVLRRSYRCRQAILDSATEALDGIPEDTRKEKDLYGEPGGVVSRDTPFYRAVKEAWKGGGTTYVLARTNRQVWTVSNVLREMGIPHLNVNPRKWPEGASPAGVRLFAGTKHSAKGKEADAVVSVQFVPDSVVARGDPYEEARLEYVARSRAKDVLYLA